MGIRDRISGIGDSVRSLGEVGDNGGDLPFKARRRKMFYLIIYLDISLMGAAFAGRGVAIGVGILDLILGIVLWRKWMKPVVIDSGEE